MTQQPFDRRHNDSRISELTESIESLVHETRVNMRLILVSLCLLAGANSPLVVEVVKSLFKIV